MSVPTKARQTLVNTLRREVARLEVAHLPSDDRPISTGAEALDHLLPADGLRRGTLVEYLAAASGSGAGGLALFAAREACREGRRALVVLDCPAGASRMGEGRFYPPAAVAWGIDLSQVIVLRPANPAEALWACDQALRCAGVAAVWSAWGRLDVRDFRRLQLAAECGRTLGLLVRPAELRGQPTWADVQWEVTPHIREHHRGRSSISSRLDGRKHSANSSWRLQVELVRCRGGPGGQIVQLELDERTGVWREGSDHATHPVPAPSRVADSAAARRV